MRKCILSAFMILVTGLVSSFGAFANDAANVESVDPQCTDSKLLSGKLITDICWDCLFPLRLSGATLAAGDGIKPEKAYDKPFCVCFDAHNVPEPGFAASMWEPAFIFEQQRTPGCMSSLNGTKVNVFDKVFRGTHDSGAYDSTDPAFNHYHYYSFPLLSMLEMFTANACNPDGYIDIDLLFFSEIDPTWNLDELAFFTTPEAALVANPLAVIACTADALSSTAKKPLESMFWCAGSWGNMYPLTGNVTGGNGTVQNSSLQKARVLNLLHRRGAARETVGQDAMCYPKVKVTLPKNNYKFTMFHPVPETKKAHVFGESTLTWGSNRIIPAVGEDPIYVIWRWKDCCMR